MNADFDLAVIGSGFAGSLVAMMARRVGKSVILLERGRHPRFVIGESTTPLTNLLLEEAARRYELPRLLPLTKWGTWQRAYPEVACGLKRGFTFYHHTWNREFGPDPGHEKQLLVAASPRDEIADTHWYRPDFDHFLVREAQAHGVEYLDQTALDTVTLGNGQASLNGVRQGQAVSVRARFVIDATGPRGFLHRALALPAAQFEHLPATQGLYTHFTGVRRLDGMGICGRETPPYPVDDAAVHHLFEGGWIWVLRFNNGVTSAGVAARHDLAGQLRFADGEAAWRRLLERLPTVREQFKDTEIQFPFIHAPRLPFRSGVVSGPNWALLPSAAGFVDPLLSTGFPLTLLGILRLVRMIEEDWGTERFSQRLQEYASKTIKELLAAEQLVAALYANMNDFPTFAALSLLYFAAVSYSETARRLGRPELAPGFLMVEHPQFGPQSRACCEQALAFSAPRDQTPVRAVKLKRTILDLIEPIDVAGLGDGSRRNWHPAKAADLLNAAHKLGVSRADIEELLKRCGFLPTAIGS